MIKKAPPSPMKLLPLAVALMYSPHLLAQEDSSQVIEVTAQKRKEKIKDVPLAITAISGEALEDRGIEGPKALTGVVPNLQMSQAPSSSLIASVGMRGITSGQPSIWADPSVGLYVDGVFVGKNMGALFDVVDIARLEALRGPQGTLFGRNTEAGALNFVTRKPTGEFGGSVGVEFGNHSRKVGRLSVDLPKMGILSASVAARSETQDGVVDNPTGEAWGGRDRKASRLSLRLEPSKDLTIDYAYDKSKIDETPPAASLLSSKGYGSLYPATTSVGGQAIFFQCLSFSKTTGACVYPGLGPAIAPYVNTAYPTSVGASTQLAGVFGANFQRLNLDGHSVIAEYKLNPSTTLRYIGAKRDMAYADHTDTDGTPVLVFESLRETDYSTSSHEFQIVGMAGNARYVGGLYLFKDDGTSLQRQAGDFYTFTPGNPNYRMTNYDLTTNAKAVYGQVDWDVGDFGFGVGGRHTRETKTIHAWRYDFKKDSSYNTTGATPTLNVNGETSFSQFTPTFNLLYRLNKDTNLFGRIARGFKSGGFPAEAPVTATAGPTTPFSPETSTSYEAGVKTSVLGGKGQISANVFLTQVKDYQISLLPPGSTSPTIVNAGKLRTSGFELDGSIVPADGTRITIAYGYLSAKFGEYLAYDATGKQQVDAASNTVVAGAPKHTLSLSLDQRLMRTGSGMTLRGLVDWRYISERYSYPGQISATVANATVGNTAADSLRPALSTLDLRLVLNNIKAFGPGDFEITAWVKNATNVHKTIAHIDVGGFYQIGFWNDPRTYGLGLNYKW